MKDKRYDGMIDHQGKTQKQVIDTTRLAVWASILIITVLIWYGVYKIGRWVWDNFNAGQLTAIAIGFVVWNLWTWAVWRYDPDKTETVSSILLVILWWFGISVGSLALLGYIAYHYW